MKKTIALSGMLILSALGLACEEPAANKPANNAATANNMAKPENKPAENMTKPENKPADNMAKPENKPADNMAKPENKMADNKPANKS